MAKLKNNSNTSHNFSRCLKQPHWQMIYGVHAAQFALRNLRRKLHCIFVNPNQPQLLAAAEQRGITVYSHHEINLPANVVHQDVVLFAMPLAQPELRQFVETKPERSCCLVLDQLEDPQNLGNILRSAAVMGISAILVPSNNSAKITSNVIKIASGAYEQVPVITVTNLARALDTLKEGGFWVMGLSEHGEQTISAINDWHKMPHVAIVIGNEGEGLRQLTAASCDFLVQLPYSTPDFSTLNAATAAAIAMYEWKRNE